MRNTLVTASVVILLGACSSGPSESEISAAAQKQIDQANAAMKGVAGMAGALAGGQSAGKVADAFAYKLISVRKIGCKGDGPAYICDVEMETEAPLVGRQKSMRPIKLVKASDGWGITN